MIAIVGTGNLAAHLVAYFKKIDQQIEAVISRGVGEEFNGIPVKRTRDLTPLVAQWIFFAIPDRCLISLGKSYKWRKDQILVHCSGGSSLGILPSKDHGVFYPLQTFSRWDFVDWRHVPVFVEGSNDKVTRQLLHWGEAGARAGILMSSDKRKRLHLLAVVVANFPVFLWAIARKEAQEANLDFAWYEPLIKKSLDKLLSTEDLDALTGPAKRGDRQTLMGHLKDLNDPLMKDMYRAMSNAILEKFGHEHLEHT